MWKPKILIGSCKITLKVRIYESNQTENKNLSSLLKPEFLQPEVFIKQ